MGPETSKNNTSRINKSLAKKVETMFGMNDNKSTKRKRKY